MDSDQPPIDPEDYYLAPQSQRPFNAGIKRKRVDFVPASDPDTSIPSTLPPQPNSKAGARYLSIVLGSTDQNQPRPQTFSGSSTLASTPTSTTEPSQEQSRSQSPEPTTLCPICAHPTTPSTLKSHLASITHQLHLEHSHPPSHLDRSRKGLKYLEGYGWDPDARVGLGARSEGIRVPIRPAEKRDTAGLGLFTGSVEEDDGDHSVRGGRLKARGRRVAEVEPVARLNAKQVRVMEEQKKKRAEKLRSTFYGQDLSQYLGDEG